jgi:hypothetical protein
VLEFDIESYHFTEAADVKDGGRYTAYTDGAHLNVFDSSSGEVRRILDVNLPTGCASERGISEVCSTSFLRPSWSPNGAYLALNQVFHEGGQVHVVDVSTEPAAVTTVEYKDIYPYEWSPFGNSLCAIDLGTYDREISLVVARAPDWRPSAYLTDYQSGLLRTPGLPDPDSGDRGMWGCVWLDESRVAVIHDVFIGSGERPKEILVLDLETSDVRSLLEHNEFTSSRGILPVSGRDLLISQFRHFTEYPDPIGDNTTPDVVDTQTGARTAILTTEDRVVAAVPAEMLAP